MKQGSILKIDFTPTEGHEQSGYRPALVISCSLFNKLTELALVCPITNTKRNNLLHVALPDCIEATGYVMTEQVRVFDLQARKYRIIDRVPKETMEEVSQFLKASVSVDDDYD